MCPSDVAGFLAANRANWDARAVVHAASRYYGVERFVDDRGLISGAVAWDAEQLGDLAGLDVLHLQCHIGTDSISLARLGANVTAVDFSPRSLKVICSSRTTVTSLPANSNEDSTEAAARWPTSKCAIACVRCSCLVKPCCWSKVKSKVNRTNKLPTMLGNCWNTMLRRYYQAAATTGRGGCRFLPT